MTVIDNYNGQDVTATSISLNVGSGLNTAMKVAPHKYELGDEVYVICKAKVRRVAHEPLTKDDFDGPLRLVVTMEPMAATVTDDPKVLKLIAAHEKAVNKASEIEGQLSIEDDMPEVDDQL